MTNNIFNIEKYFRDVLFYPTRLIPSTSFIEDVNYEIQKENDELKALLNIKETLSGSSSDTDLLKKELLSIPKLMEDIMKDTNTYHMLAKEMMHINDMYYIEDEDLLKLLEAHYNTGRSNDD